MIKRLIGFVGLYVEVVQHFFYIAYLLEKEFRKNKTKPVNVSTNMKNTGERLEHLNIKKEN